jgi:NADH:ubiquinone oxidoreductase subunit 5 (subunit L)/multisubunit Na+/H+ antiporter MnhA subunit
MHEMGGLIKKMPAQYIAVLIGIIALSGVPPLSGFAGKWLIYNALIEKEWYFIAGVLMFASVIAFLYLFRLIHTIFLGQLKPEHRDVREAPVVFVVAQALLVFAIMGISMFPDALLKVTTVMIFPFFREQGVHFARDGSLLVESGYFNAFGIMAMVMGLFAIFFAWVLFLGPKTRKVGQLDIVFAAEEPPPPEEIHYAYDFYRPYKRAFAPVLRLSAERGWRRASDALSTVADYGRRFYTGDAQTYLLYAVVFLGIAAAVVFRQLAG